MKKSSIFIILLMLLVISPIVSSQELQKPAICKAGEQVLTGNCVTECVEDETAFLFLYCCNQFPSYGENGYFCAGKYVNAAPSTDPNVVYNERSIIEENYGFEESDSSGGDLLVVILIGVVVLVLVVAIVVKSGKN